MDSAQQFDHSEFGHGDPRFTEDFSHFQSLQVDSLETPDPFADSGQVNQALSVHHANFNSGDIPDQFNMNIDMSFPVSSLIPTSGFGGSPSLLVETFEPGSLSVGPEPATFRYLADPVGPFSGTALGPQIMALDDSEIQLCPLPADSALNLYSDLDSSFMPQRTDPQSGRRPRVYCTAQETTSCGLGSIGATIKRSKSEIIELGKRENYDANPVVR